MLVNRVKGDHGSLSGELGAQLLGNPVTLRTAAVGALVIGLIPGMPKVPFIAMTVGLWVGAGRVARKGLAPAPASDVTVTTDPDDPEVLMSRMRTDPLEIRLAYDTTDLVSGDLLARIRELRRQLASEMGFVMPQVATTDDATLPAGEYRIALYGVDVGSGRAPVGAVLALPDPVAADDLALAGLGERVVEPVFGLIGYWVPEQDRATASATGATIVPRSAAVVTHLAEVARQYAPELLSRQQVADLVDVLRSEEPLLANEVGSERLPLTTLHLVLRSLLSERVSIRDLGRVVEVISSVSSYVHGPDALADEVRAVLGAQITSAVAPGQRVSAVLFVPDLEGQLLAALRDVDGTTHLALEPEMLDAVRESVRAAWERLAGGDPVVLTCAPALRRPLSRVLSAAGIDLPVLAYRELPRHLEIAVTEVIGGSAHV
jgi:flagellar biosynthesis protein FlhA